MQCNRCGSEDVVKHSLRRSKLGETQQYRCKECLSYFSGKLIPYSKEKLEQLKELRGRFARKASMP